ncbi:prolipoprotein diacylglyceryl transferase [Thiosocius teredinicola]|uniref:hypothetical protein n=1 Tax=Thiosocius teredinicola TaxID=1973002 RepID=UPI0009914953
MSSTTWMIIGALVAEVVLILIVLLGAFWFRTQAARRRDAKAIKTLIERVQGARKDRGEAIEQYLSQNVGFEGDMLAAAKVNLLRAELSLLQRFAAIYRNRDAAAAAQFDIDVISVVGLYQEMGGPGGEGGENHSELEALRAENAGLSDELRMTMETMSRMLKDYSHMFANGPEGAEAPPEVAAAAAALAGAQVAGDEPVPDAVAVEAPGEGTEEASAATAAEDAVGAEEQLADDAVAEVGGEDISSDDIDDLFEAADESASDADDLFEATDIDGEPEPDNAAQPSDGDQAAAAETDLSAVADLLEDMPEQVADEVVSDEAAAPTASADDTDLSAVADLLEDMPEEVADAASEKAEATTAPADETDLSAVADLLEEEAAEPADGGDEAAGEDDLSAVADLLDAMPEADSAHDEDADKAVTADDIDDLLETAGADGVTDESASDEATADVDSVFVEESSEIVAQDDADDLFGEDPFDLGAFDDVEEDTEKDKEATAGSQ